MPTFTLAGGVQPNGATGIQSGQIVNAYAARRFANPLATPATNDSAPGSADYGPYTTISLGGDFSFATTTFEPFNISWYDPLDVSNGGSWNLYWLGPILPQSPTNVQGWTGATNVSTSRYTGSTTITASSYGALPQTTLNVTSTTNFSPSGLLIVQPDNGFPVYTVMAYATKDATHFYGCSGGTGTVSGTPLNTLVIQGYQAGPTRRLLLYTGTCYVSNNSDSAIFGGYATIGGQIMLAGQCGIGNWPSTAAYNASWQLTLPIDPLGYYGIQPSIRGSGVVNLVGTGTWVEVDD